jgi:hypothetical protein
MFSPVKIRASGQALQTTRLPKQNVGMRTAFRHKADFNRRAKLRAKLRNPRRIAILHFQSPKSPNPMRTSIKIVQTIGGKRSHGMRKNVAL